jgi:hypothetical protein
MRGLIGLDIERRGAHFIIFNPRDRYLARIKGAAKGGPRGARLLARERCTNVNQTGRSRLLPFIARSSRAAAPMPLALPRRSSLARPDPLGSALPGALSTAEIDRTIHYAMAEKSAATRARLRRRLD